MNNITKEKITKALSAYIPDSASDGGQYAIYDSFDKNVRIIQYYENSEFALIRKDSLLPESLNERELTEAEILVFLKEKLAPKVAHIGDSNGIKSLNFIQDCACDVRKLPKTIELPKAKKIEIINIAMEKMHPALADMTDEQIIEKMIEYEAMATLCRQTLEVRGVTSKDKIIKALKNENEQKRLNKANNLKPDGTPKTVKMAKPMLTKEEKQRQVMFGDEYNSPEKIAEYNEFMASLKGSKG